MIDIAGEYLNKLGKNLKVIEDKVKEIGRVRSIAEATKAARKAAEIIAIDEILLADEGTESIALRVLTQVALDACAESKEYDYGLFTKRLTGAIIANADNIFRVFIAGKKINIDLSPLGFTGQWIAAAAAARQKFDIGKSRLAKKRIGGVHAASQFWMEKIYKPAREGKAIPQKRKKSELPPSLEASGHLLQPKVATSPKEKYDKIIKERLSYFSEKQAPFWEILDKGNTTIKGGEGTPYPIFGPTEFVDKAAKILTALFRQSISIYEPKVLDALWSTLPEDAGMARKGPIGTPADIKRILTEAVQSDVNRARYGKTPLPAGKQTISKVEAINVTYETYAISGKVYVRARGAGGRFIKSLLEIE
jgi:hypothetical protein